MGPQNGRMNKLPGALVRAAIIIGLWYAFRSTIDLWFPRDADPLGVGFAAFYAQMSLMGVWGIVDGWRRGHMWALPTWAIAGALIVMAEFAIPDILDNLRYGTRGLGWGVQVSGFFTMWALFTVPALVGAAIGGFLHKSKPDQGASR